MNRGIATLRDLLPADLLFPQPPPPTRENRAPSPKPPKVIGDPTRTPVNRQAAMLMSKPAEFHQPPFPPAPPIQPEIITLREENAKLKLANTTITNENKALRRRIERLTILVNQKPKPQPAAPTTPAPWPSTSPKLQLLERLTNGR